MRAWFKSKMGRTGSRTFSKSDINLEETTEEAYGISRTKSCVENDDEGYREILESSNLIKSSLPQEFAGKVLKLEMQLDKGASYVSKEDLDSLVDLYTQAVEYYNSNMQMERQKYYQNKLMALLESSSMQKVYANHNSAKKENEKESEPVIDKKSPEKPVDPYKQSQMRWTKNALTMAVHQKEKEQNTKVVQAATIDHIKETQKQKRDTVKEITKDMKM